MGLHNRVALVPRVADRADAILATDLVGLWLWFRKAIMQVSKVQRDIDQAPPCPRKVGPADLYSPPADPTQAATSQRFSAFVTIDC
eukprot:9497096-Pyramimonas_sp.AAC.2